jgi:hypothetical protein
VGSLLDASSFVRADEVVAEIGVEVLRRNARW